MMGNRQGMGGSVLPTEDKEVVFAERLRDSYYEEIQVMKETMQTIRENSLHEGMRGYPKPVKKFLTATEMLRMVNSYAIKPKDGGMGKDIAGELIILIDMYMSWNMEPGLDYTFLDYFKTQINQCFNEYLNSLSETMQTRLRSHTYE